MSSSNTNITISASQKLELISTLDTLTNAGIPLSEAFEALETDSKGKFLIIVQSIKQDIDQGIELSQAMARFPQVFDQVTLSLIKAAEASGTLDQVFTDLTKNINKQTAFRGKIRAALIYPIVVIVSFSGLLLVMLLFVLPRVASVFRQTTTDIPFTTRILLKLSDLINEYTTLILVSILFLMVITAFLFKKYFPLIRSITYKLPGLIKIATKVDLAQYAHNASLLLKSGIPLPDVLDLCFNIVNTPTIKKLILSSKQSVVQGSTISQGMDPLPKHVPPITTRIIHVGEKSGTLEKSYAQLAIYFQKQVEEELKTIAALIEPALLVIIGIIMAVVILSIMNPIYNLIGSLTVQ